MLFFRTGQSNVFCNDIVSKRTRFEVLLHLFSSVELQTNINNLRLVNVDFELKKTYYD